MQIQSRNLHYAFNVEYFSEALNARQNDDAKPLNEAVLALANQKERASILKSAKSACDVLKTLPGVRQMNFRVRWPGLMMGTGYPHTLKQLTGEIQMGFTFDYVTGAPYYPGSSVKGVLRSAFSRAFPEEKSRISKDMREAYKEYLKEHLAELTKERKSETGEITDDDVMTVLQWSFEGKEKKDGNSLPMANRDVFYDAYIVGFAKAQQRAILGFDNLTPHIDKDGNPDPTQEPTPITMLRVMPETVVSFSMRLCDVRRTDGTLLLSADEKEQLYRNLLEDFGIGAKTNVGYGSLEFYGGDVHDPAVAPAPAPRRNEQAQDRRRDGRPQEHGRGEQARGPRHDGRPQGPRRDDRSNDPRRSGPSSGRVFTTRTEDDNDENPFAAALRAAKEQKGKKKPR